jgi:hypothetical protein
MWSVRRDGPCENLVENLFCVYVEVAVNVCEIVA